MFEQVNHMPGKPIIRYTLEEVLDLLRRGKSVLKVGKRTTVLSFAEAANVGAKSTVVRDKLRDAQKYGLIRITKSPPKFWEGEFELTELGSILLDPTTDTEKYQKMYEIYKSVDLVGEILDNYSVPPSYENMVKILRDRGIPHERAKQLAKKVKTVIDHAFEVARKVHSTTGGLPENRSQQTTVQQSDERDRKDRIVVIIPGIATIYVVDEKTKKAAIDLLEHFANFEENSEADQDGSA